MSSQTSSSEVSKKLKAAIRAKLEELGVYVDDELPDYIMVMIANKKEKSQMKVDLNLFMGKNTSKFVDWLFDLFERLRTVSSQPEKSKTKEADTKKRESEETAKKAKEAERRKQEERQELEEREKAREREREKEKERERAREKERERQREKEREKKKEKHETRKRSRNDKERSRHRRSRSRTWSDEEPSKQRPRRHSELNRENEKSEEDEKKKVASVVLQKNVSVSPEPPRVQSTVVINKPPRPAVGDTQTTKARSSMFLKAMNEASVSAGYATHKKSEEVPEKVDYSSDDAEDDMSDVDALPSKKVRKTVYERLKYKNKNSVPIKSVKRDENSDSVVLDENEQETNGPQVIVKLSGGKEAIKKLRLQDRMVLRDNAPPKREAVKRKIVDDEKIEKEQEDQPKSKHERIVFDLSPTPKESSESPTMKKWNGQIKIDEESDTSDEEAAIDSVLAETRGYVKQNDEMLPPMRQLSGVNYVVNPAFQQQPQQQQLTYIPTPIAVLNEQHSAVNHQPEKPIMTKDETYQKERCLFWPQCKKENCPYHHPVKDCTNFPNCPFANRCLFIHPGCRFDMYCTKKQCPYTHYGTGGIQPSSSNILPITGNKRPTATVAPQPKSVTNASAGNSSLSAIAAKLAASLEAKNISKTSKSEIKPVAESEEVGKTPTAAVAHVKPIEVVETKIEASLSQQIPCRFAGACRTVNCQFKHPKECRFGINCRNPSCYFYHKPTEANKGPSVIDQKKYKWTATA